MQSTNFEFLRPEYPQLADLGAFAEDYARSDPDSSRVKSRMLAEAIASRLCAKLGLKIYEDSFLSMLKELEGRRLLPKQILDLFHYVRISGNSSAHPKGVSGYNAIETLKSAFDLARWWLAFNSQNKAEIPEKFIPLPGRPQNAESAGKLDADFKALQKQLIAENKKLRERVQNLDERLAALAACANAAVDALGLDEAATRKRLVDAMLADAGWHLDDGDEVAREDNLDLPVNPSGKGRADYVLYDDDGTALAVIEAKRTAIDPAAGRIEAKNYADALEKRDPGGVRPLIILTNGFESRLVDDCGGPKSLGVRGYADRMIFGIPAKENLAYRVRFQRKQMRDPALIAHRADIAGGPGREYQLEAIKAVAERFGEQRKRKALVVQATGTGKTRVAVAIAELLNRASFVKRVLFLCDRNELRRQAKNAFTRFLPDWNIQLLGSGREKTAQVLIATYQGMMNRLRDFDIAWFDLIIADESHRSIYNKYRDIFLYFDALQLGLTATPVKQISRNTFAMFDCGNGNPTYYYDYERAVREGALVDYTPIDVTTRFLRDGIHYNKLSDEEKRALEEDGLEDLDVDAADLDKQTFNLDTNRKILHNLMENGLRDKTENGPGKSIIFARGHKHAELLRQLFQEMYPEFGPGYCEVIDSHIERNEQLLDDFKTHGKNPVIAVSVDMLDTGVDVPEVLNLVFAKPVKSLVKFWQMIGRGTRLCADLHGPGRDKKCFYIFDHWGNFEYFDTDKPKKEAERTPSLLERLFKTRLSLAEKSLEKCEKGMFDIAVSLMRQLLNSLPDSSLPVREKYKYKFTALRDNVLESFAPNTVKMLRQVLLPLMRYVPVNRPGEQPAYEFDLLIAELQTALLTQPEGVAVLRARLDNSLAKLKMNIAAVQEKFAHIKELRSKEFWTKPLDILLAALEEKRLALRGIMQYSKGDKGDPTPPLVIDVADSDVVYTPRKSALPSPQEMRAYKERLRQTLEPYFAADPTLQKLRRGEAFTDADFEKLVSLVLTQNAGVDLNTLREFYPATSELEKELRSIIGMDADTVRESFAIFHQKYPGMNSRQIAFLNMLQKHIQQFGPIQASKLYEPPFTTLSATGPEGLFSDSRQFSDLLFVLNSLFPAKRTL